MTDTPTAATSSHGSGPFIAAIDQGTTSSRCIVFDRDGRIVAVDQKEHEQIFPKPGWVEHDAAEIWANVQEVVAGAIGKAAQDIPGFTPADVKAIGITNQRETTLLWDKHTGEPVHNALVWQDTRTDALCRELGRNVGQDRFRRETGLPLASYFAGPKIRWLLDNVEGLRERAEAGDILFGTMDSWVIWNLTGGVRGGVHVTDVTNASRTLLMNLHDLGWDEKILASIGVPAAVLPEIRSSSEVYGTTSVGGLDDVPVASALGDQQAALFGQTCFAEGEAKSTYGTGTFMLMNTGGTPVNSYNGLITTVGYRIGDDAPVYALEGSIAVTGSLVQWMRDQMGLISTAAEIETLASSVEDNGGAYFVPAFSGLFAPYWRDDARGVIAGLTRYVTKAHIARAVLEATAWQTREIADAMTKDSGVELTALKVDGGMTVEQPADADARRLPGRAGGAARWSPRPPAWARPTRPGWRSASGRTPTPCARTGSGPPNGRPAWTRPTATASTTTGSRPYSGPWAGSKRSTETRHDHPPAARSLPGDAPDRRREPRPGRDPRPARARRLRPPGDRRRHPGHHHRLARRPVGAAGGHGGRRRLRRRHLLGLLQAAPRRPALPADRRGEAGRGEPRRAARGLPGRRAAPGQAAHLLPAGPQGRPARRGQARRGRLRVLRAVGVPRRRRPRHQLRRRPPARCPSCAPTTCGRSPSTRTGR